jgi:FtsZ-binding cell division protein ZapB
MNGEQVISADDLLIDALQREVADLKATVAALAKDRDDDAHLVTDAWAAVVLEAKEVADLKRKLESLSYEHANCSDTRDEAINLETERCAKLADASVRPLQVGGGISVAAANRTARHIAAGIRGLGYEWPALTEAAGKVKP